MKPASALRYAATAMALLSTAMIAYGVFVPKAEGNVDFVDNGRAGFIVGDIAYVLSRDSEETRACPNGRTTSDADVYRASAEGQRREGESNADYTRRAAQTTALIETASNGQHECQAPQLSTADPSHPIVTGANVPVNGGIDLDGQISRATGRAAPGTCVHDDFTSVEGRRGVDNQLFRAVGCMPSYQPTGGSVPFAIEMLTGAWGILITLDGVDDVRNDPDITVGIYANGDPIQLSPNRVPLPSATYAIHQDPRFHAQTRGRIVNGVLTTDPTNIALPKITNNWHYVRTLNRARLEATLSADGVLDGYLAGYTLVEDIYDFQFALRHGTAADGEPRPPLRASLGNALGYTCRGIYHALLEVADGDRDPATGRCSSVSTQYHIRAIPAFVVAPESNGQIASLPHAP